MQLKNALFFIVTFFVALCSIVYELVYSQLLTVVFGGTVLRYSLTIGLFLFCLGVGSFLYNYLAKYDKKKVFILVEIALSVVGFLGAVFIIWLNSQFSFLPHLLRVVLSNIPVVLIGILSGLDLPLLSFFAGEKSSAYSQVLGMDYFGSLAGTLIYSLFLYPYQGLIFSAAVVAFINLLIAFSLFIFLYKKRSISFIVVFSVLICAFVFVLTNISFVSESLMKIYLSHSIVNHYNEMGVNNLIVNIGEFFFTPYQMVFLYSLVMNPGTSYELNNTCLNIDEHVQLCDSWAKEYHNGLIDVPMSFIEESSPNTKVLIVGGGDGIAVEYLRKYNVSVDLVDIDKEFVDYSRNSGFINKYNNGSFDYPLLNLTIDDGFSYLKDNDKKYDLIVLDLPGLKEDKLLPLYSQEFFIALNRSLSDVGMVVMWVYPFSKNEEYSKILMNTLSKAGFKYYFPYKSYILPGGVNRVVEDYILVSNRNYLRMDMSKNDYVSSLAEFYQESYWQKIIVYANVETNSVFKPNYRMLIEND